jgi:nucleoside-diphosphate-sugar epimerase
MGEQYFMSINDYPRLKKSNVIVGKGMVAGACKALKGWEDDILFASGVSNSSEHRKELFEKEIEMISHYLGQKSSDGSFVYFSTASILDPSKAGNPYIMHKLAVEGMLRERNVKHLIVRLPNLVGVSNNPHTLTNFFAQSIKTGKPIRLVKNAIRHLIDADDLVSILNAIKYQFGKTNATVNVSTNTPLTALQILNMLEDTLNMKALVMESKDEPASDSKMMDIYSSANYIFETPGNYHQNLFHKYYAS